MGQFVRQRGSVALRVPERLERRHLHEVRPLRIKSPRSAMANVGAGRGKETVSSLDPLQRGEGRVLGFRGVEGRKVLALLGIEHGVALQEGNFALDLLALLVRLGSGDPVGIDHKLAGLALPDITAKLQRLLEGQPKRAGIAFHGRGRPKHDDVDSLVGGAVVPQGAADPTCRMRGVPGPKPGANALLKVGNDLVRDPAVNVRAGCLSGAHGPDLLWLDAKQRVAASRGRVSGGDGGGKEASRGTGCTEPAPLCAGGGSWAEASLGERRGNASRPPLKAASAAA